MTESSRSTELVQIDRQGRLCVLRMNRPDALNALNLDLIESLTRAIETALADDSVQTLWLESTSARSFCAGGDVKALARALAAGDPDAQRETGYRYFLAEYRLDALIEHCPKPIVAWGEGLVMGGGWGLLAGADLKLVTADARFAMPELQIGLFPDVGAAHFLQKPDWRAGTLLGITGLHLSGLDAAALGYVDAVLEPPEAGDLKARLADGMAVEDWTAPAPPERVATLGRDWRAALDHLPAPNLADWVAHLRHCDFEPFRQAVKLWRTGSALSLALTWHHFKRLRRADRVTALSQDLIVGANACSEKEFAEGVRALLVDKDKQPNWLYPNIESVPFTLIERFYRPLPFATEAIGRADRSHNEDPS